MSGIAGIIRFDGGDAEPRLLEGMTAAMAHRGPDGIGHWVDGGGALDQCMLHTTPESLEEVQPLVSEDKHRVLVMGGRVDNWEALRSRLLERGCRLSTRSDAELVLKAYEAWGEDCLAYIDGDFALALGDGHRRALFCARDRIGAKPFYYHRDGQRLAFASEMKPIVALPWVKQEIDEGVIAAVIADDRCSLDETWWQCILRLVAAHRMVIDGGRVQLSS